MKENEESHQEKDRVEGPILAAQKRSASQRLLSVVLVVLTCVVAVPVLLIYLIKSPSPLQNVYIFGISYYNLVFIFLISAVSLIFSVLFFLRPRLLVSLTILTFSLFCCVPLIIGLKNELTLQQAILSAPFFAHWPFFLRPFYILTEFLLPMGVLIFLFLQVKNIFSRRPHGYIFLGVSLYLAAAAFIGFSGLLQAGEPTIITALARHDTSDLAPERHRAVLEQSSANHAAKEQEIHSNDSQTPVSQGQMTVGPENDYTHNALPIEDSKSALLDHNTGLSAGKADALSDALEPVDGPLTGKVQSAKTSLESLSPARSHDVPILHENLLAQIDYRLGLLSGTITQMAETLEQLKKPAAENQQSATVDIGQKVEELVIKLDQLLSTLDHNEYFLTQQQGSVERRGKARSTPAKDRTISSDELAGLLDRIERLSDKVNRVSAMRIEKGGDNTEER